MRHHTHPLLSPVPGTQRALESFHFGPDDAARRVYIQGSLHADELPGMLVAWKLKQRLKALEEAGQLKAHVIVVPVANPIGLDQQLMDIPLGRYDFESVSNFNRGYRDLTDAIAESLETALTQDPAHNRDEIRRRFIAALDAIQATSTYESLHLTQQRLACEADFILDLHCDFHAVEHLYTTPAAWPDFEPLARYFGAKASMLATDSGGGSFDECFTLVWEQLRRSRHLSLAEVFRMEWCLAVQCTLHADFREGVRALLIDKDGKPRFRHRDVDQVDPEYIDGFFQNPAPQHPLADL